MFDEPIVQIAGVVDQAEADLLVSCGVRWLGFPLRLAVHAEDLSEREAAGVIRRLDPPTRAVLITYLKRADEIAAFCSGLGVTVVQLHGDVEKAELARLRELAPELTVIKSLIVGRGAVAHDLVADARALESVVDAFITDTFDPATGATGATGKTHDWSESRRIVRATARPVILAGGLTPENVGQAIREVMPAGVDAHTGVEGPDGRKDADRVRRFLAAAKDGFAAIRS